MSRRNSRKSGSARGSGGGDSTCAELHFTWNGTLTGGIIVASLNATGLATLSTRFLALGDAYAYFRYRSFKFRIHPANSAGAQAAGFSPVLDTNPATVAQVTELISSTVIDTTQTKPTEWVNVRRDDLSGPFPWYKTIDGTPDSTEEFPGRFPITGGATDTFLVEFRVVVELKEGVAPANTPEELELLKKHRAGRVQKANARARDDIMRALSVPVNPPGNAPLGLQAPSATVPSSNTPPACWNPVRFQ